MLSTSNTEAFAGDVVSTVILRPSRGARTILRMASRLRVAGPKQQSAFPVRCASKPTGSSIRRLSFCQV